MDWKPADIVALRGALGLSQRAFAERLGVRYATVADWERGQGSPSKMAVRLLETERKKLTRKRDAV